MTPQPVFIYGVRCTLRESAGATGYAVVGPRGVLLTEQPYRLLAVAEAARVLRERQVAA